MDCYYPLNLFHEISNHKGWVSSWDDFLKGLSPISFVDSRTKFLKRSMVNWSTTFFSDLTKSMDITFLLKRFLINLHLTCRCLFIFLFVWDWFNKSITTLLSQCTDIIGRDLLTKGISKSKFLIHSTSMHVVSSAISSDSFVLLDIIVCFLHH